MTPPVIAPDRDGNRIGEHQSSSTNQSHSLSPVMTSTAWLRPPTRVTGRPAFPSPKSTAKAPQETGDGTALRKLPTERTHPSQCQPGWANGVRAGQLWLGLPTTSASRGGRRHCNPPPPASEPTSTRCASCCMAARPERFPPPRTPSTQRRPTPPAPPTPTVGPPCSARPGCCAASTRRSSGWRPTSAASARSYSHRTLLPLHDRCDRCGTAATVRALLPTPASRCS
jgi:hypothetical protein